VPFTRQKNEGRAQAGADLKKEKNEGRTSANNHGLMRPNRKRKGKRKIKKKKRRRKRERWAFSGAYDKGGRTS